MGVGVIAKSVAFADDSSHDFRVPVNVVAADEERRGHVFIPQDVEDFIRIGWRRTVVERQRHFLRIGGPSHKGWPEQR